MRFERIFSENLALNSYSIGDTREAAIDSRGDGDICLEMAARNACPVTHIFETHRNEDYVIGSLPRLGPFP
ncbi:MAG: MBL fold metallo-hydrolase, partial [Methanoregula sp.]